jgi:hypothetical protein
MIVGTESCPLAARDYNRDAGRQLPDLGIT